MMMKMNDYSDYDNDDDNNSEYGDDDDDSDDDVGVDGYIYYLYVLLRFTDNLCSGH